MYMYTVYVHVCTGIHVHSLSCGCGFIVQQLLFKIFLNSWKPPRYISVASSSRHERIRNKWHILTEGEDLPPPIKTFKV